MNSKYTILVVEDSPIDRFRLHSFLDSDYSVIEAENGIEALKIIEEESKINLIISDLLMPEMSGKEFLSELAEKRNLNELPVLIATGADDIDSELECLELGCSDFIRKPYNPTLLKMRIENTLERVEYNFLKQNKIRDAFGKYVDPSVVSTLLDAPAAGMPNLRDITVLFADIRQFTAISETLSPEGVLELLNRCFEITGGCVKKYGGVLDKYIGDCTMAFWGAPNDCEDGAYLACCAALEMMSKTKELFKEYSAKSGIEISLGIGINKGNAIAGNVGFSDRMNYTVVGDAVNVASRLESIAPPNTIYLGDSVFESVRDRVVAEKYPSELILKGKQRPVDVYRLTGILD